MSQVRTAARRFLQATRHAAAMAEQHGQGAPQHTEALKDHAAALKALEDAVDQEAALEAEPVEGEGQEPGQGQEPEQQDGGQSEESGGVTDTGAFADVDGR